jgi:tRNA-binding EMAP/Myf-like protein
MSRITLRIGLSRATHLSISSLGHRPFITSFLPHFHPLHFVVIKKYCCLDAMNNSVLRIEMSRTMIHLAKSLDLHLYILTTYREDL